jgi:hypothetical protein
MGDVWIGSGRLTWHSYTGGDQGRVAVESREEGAKLGGGSVDV